MTKPIHFIINRHTNRAEILTAPDFQNWEVVQWSFRVGFRMSDGQPATGIGRCKSLEQFIAKARHGNTTILNPQSNEQSGSNCFEEMSTFNL